MLEIAIGAIIVALIFDFVNGFNDSANSVATVDRKSTRQNPVTSLSRMPSSA